MKTSADIPTEKSAAIQSSALLQMSIVQVLIKVAIPASLTFLMNMVFGLVDAYWVGRLGAQAMASLSAASILTWVLYSIGALGEVGVHAYVSQSVGAGNEELAKRAVLSGMILHVAVAAIVLIPIYLFRFHIFRALGVEDVVVAGCVDYTVPFLGGMAFYFLAMVAMSAFYAVGDSKTPAMVLAGALTLNAILDPFFILGFGPIPAMGLFGAGFATAISKIVYTAAMLILLRKKGMLDLKPLFIRGKECIKMALKVGWIGLPIALNGVVFSGVYLILIKILANFGSVPIATLGIAHRIEGIAWFTCVGFGVAAAALSGQMYGAGNVKGAIKSVWHVVLYLSGIMLLISAIFIFFGGNLVSIFIDDQAVIAEGARYLFIIGIFEMFLGWEVIYEESLGAVGSSHTAFLIATPISVLRIPLAYIFGIQLGYGIAAVWWIIGSTTMLKGVLLYFAYTFGKWQRRASLASSG